MSTQEDLVRAIVAADVRDGRLIDAFREVPRAGFVPTELTERAYLDRPLTIPHGQVTTQPSLSAKMIEALALTGPERVLEVGTGYGFQTALLARLSGFVWSVERFPDVAATARENLARHGVENVEVIAGDGTRGLVQPVGSGGREAVVLFEKGPGGFERRYTVTGAHFVKLYGAHAFPSR